MQAKCICGCNSATVHASAPNKQKFFASFFQKRSAFLPFLFLLLAFPAFAQQNLLIGTWQARVALPEGPGRVTMTIQPDGSYFQSVRSAGLMTSQSGVVQVVGEGVVAFVVQDWEPKRQCFASGYCTPIREPAGGTYRVWFPNADVLELQEAAGRPVEFRRVR